MHTPVRCVQSGRAQSYIIVNRSFTTQTGRRKQSAQSKISLYLRKVTFLSVGISQAIANLHYVSGVLLLLLPSFSSLPPSPPFPPSPPSSSSARSLRLAISNWLCFVKLNIHKCNWNVTEIKGTFHRLRRNVTALYKLRLTILPRARLPPRPPPLPLSLALVSYFLTISECWNISSVITRIFKPRHLGECSRCVSGLER